MAVEHAGQPFAPIQASPAYTHARNVAIAALFGAGIVFLFLAAIAFLLAAPILSALALSVGIEFVFLFLVTYWIPESRFKPGELLWQYLRDEKGYPSVARLQFFVWTAVIVFAFTWVVFIRIFSGVAPFASSGVSLPENLLAVMGISAASTIASAGIEKSRGNKTKGERGDDRPWGSMLQEMTAEGEMTASLGRYQMLAWTLVSVAIFIGVLYSRVVQVWTGGAVSDLSLPDIDTTLLTLMGLSHVGYLGSKYIAGNPPPPPTSNRRASSGTAATAPHSKGAHT